MHEASNTIIESITNWMETFVEVPHPAFGNMPVCPYARQFRLANKVKIIEAKDNILEKASEVAKNWDNNIEAVVVASDNLQIKNTEVHEKVQQMNKDYKSIDIVMLEDHPESKEYIGGACMNHGSLILIVIQRLSKLNKFSKGLRSTKYFDNWTQENLDDTITWRFED